MSITIEPYRHQYLAPASLRVPPILADQLGNVQAAMVDSIQKRSRMSNAHYTLWHVCSENTYNNPDWFKYVQYMLDILGLYLRDMRGTTNDVATQVYQRVPTLIPLFTGAFIAKRGLWQYVDPSMHAQISDANNEFDRLLSTCHPQPTVVPTPTAVAGASNFFNNTPQPTHTQHVQLAALPQVDSLISGAPLEAIVPPTPAQPTAVVPPTPEPPKLVLQYQYTGSIARSIPKPCPIVYHPARHTVHMSDTTEVIEVNQMDYTAHNTDIYLRSQNMSSGKLVATAESLADGKTMEELLAALNEENVVSDDFILCEPFRVRDTVIVEGGSSPIVILLSQLRSSLKHDVDNTPVCAVVERMRNWACKGLEPPYQDCKSHKAIHEALTILLGTVPAVLLYDMVNDMRIEVQLQLTHRFGNYAMVDDYLTDANVLTEYVLQYHPDEKVRLELERMAQVLWNSYGATYENTDGGAKDQVNFVTRTNLIYLPLVNGDFDIAFHGDSGLVKREYTPELYAALDKLINPDLINRICFKNGRVLGLYRAVLDDSLILVKIV